MVDKILQDIGQTEQAATQTERQAVAEAAKMVQDAQAEARRLVQEGMLADEHRTARVLAEHERQCNERLQAQRSHAAQDAERIRTEAGRKMEAAVAMIVEEVRSEYGHR